MTVHSTSQDALRTAAAFNPHDYFHTRLRGTGRNIREPIYNNGVAGNIGKIAFVFKIKMMMVVDIRVEVGARAVDDDLTQQANFRKLMKRVVDGRQRNANAGRLCFGVQGFGGHMPVDTVEQKFSKGNALARRPQAGFPQSLDRKRHRPFKRRDFGHQHTYPLLPFTKRRPALPACGQAHLMLGTRRGNRQHTDIGDTTRAPHQMGPTARDLKPELRIFGHFVKIKGIKLRQIGDFPRPSGTLDSPQTILYGIMVKTGSGCLFRHLRLLFETERSAA